MKNTTNNFFLNLYNKKISKMRMDTRDLDSILNALPWKEVKKEDGTVYYTCEIQKGIGNE